jgi:hypothetical protein
MRRVQRARGGVTSRQAEATRLDEETVSRSDGSAVLSAEQLVHRLIARIATPTNDPAAIALATHAASERVYRELTRSLGQVGAAHLLSRAILIARPKHPALDQIRIDRQSTPDVTGVTAAIETFGAPATTAALEAVLATFLALLGRLIGEDLVSRLVEPALSHVPHDDRDGPR